MGSWSVVADDVMIVMIPEELGVLRHRVERGLPRDGWISRTWRDVLHNFSVIEFYLFYLVSVKVSSNSVATGFKLI